MDEKKLIGNILKGKKSYLFKFYKIYAKRLFNFIKRGINNEKDAEEILQDTFLASLEAFRDFTYRCSIYTFLCSIAKRKIIDFYRKKKLKKILFSQIPEVQPLISTLALPEDKLDEHLLKESIEKTLKLLRPKYQNILRLKYIEGFSVTEIAKKLSVTFKSAESMLFRARKDFVKVYTDT